jgi:hypothetical protein
MREPIASWYEKVSASMFLLVPFSMMGALSWYEIREGSSVWSAIDNVIILLLTVAFFHIFEALYHKWKNRNAR